jgi:hypothetical protein
LSNGQVTAKATVPQDIEQETGRSKTPDIVKRRYLNMPQLVSGWAIQIEDTATWKISGLFRPKRQQKCLTCRIEKSFHTRRKSPRGPLQNQ